VLRWVLAFLLLPSAAPPFEIAIDPGPGTSFGLVLTGWAADAGPGEFRGGVSLNGSPVEMPLRGRAEKRGGRIRLVATIPYAGVPQEWLNGFRPDTFEYRVHADVAGAGAVSWAGSMRWSDVSIVEEREALSPFVKLGSLELTALSIKRSEGRAVLAVTNPFAFPITIAAAEYRLHVNGTEIGGGAARGRILRAGRPKAPLELPFRVDHGPFLAAAGFDWAVGADLEAGLTGRLTLRLPGGDVAVPFEFLGRLGTDGARSGVFSHPDGATSLSPH